MPTLKKQQIIDEVSADIKNSTAVYFADFLGLNVAQVNDLRSSLFKDEVKMKVVKNTLISRSLKDAGYEEDMEEILSGSTALVFTAKDPVSPAKILLDTRKKSKELEKPNIKAVIFDGQLYGQEKVQQISELPSREQLLAQLLGGLNYPMTTLVSMLQSPLRNLQGVLTALKETKEA